MVKSPPSPSRKTLGNKSRMKRLELPVEITRLVLHAKCEGILEFKTSSGNLYEAFFWGKSYNEGEKVLVELDHLSLPLDWEKTFSLNALKEKKLEKLNGEGEYAGYGEIEQVAPIIANFGDIKLNLGNWSNDNRIIGEFIYWRIRRLEVALE